MKILIAEDDVVIRRLLQSFLEAWGHQVVGARDGVEAWHPEHPPNQADAYLRWAEELGMVVTAGSDYHGPGVQADRHLGDRTLSPERFAALEDRARRYAPAGPRPPRAG